MLVLDHKFSEGVVGHYTVIVGTSEGGEEAVRDGKEGHVFYVRVMFGGIGNNMVDVVVAFPPAYTKSSEEIGNEDADDGIGLKPMGYAHVACVVDCEG